MLTADKEANMEQQLSNEQIKEAVKRGYTQAVTGGGSCCSPGETLVTLEKKRASLMNVVGYTPAELEKLPEAVVENSFGCGNPLLFTEVREGDVVLDIGSGAGIDCLIAAEKVGPAGRVIGLDMTPAMIEKARANTRQAGVTNVEFRLGDAENMPVDDANVDWVISNCVINLAPDKPRVFSEVYRVLKPGGRVSISDIVLGDDLPDEVVQSVDALVGCVAGAVKEADYLTAMRAAGLTDVAVTSRFVYGEEHLRGFLDGGDSKLKLDSEARTLFAKYRDQIIGKVWSARITARKP
jgi:SAM-dependent methyltransferase